MSLFKTIISAMTGVPMASGGDGKKFETAGLDQANGAPAPMPQSQNAMGMGMEGLAQGWNPNVPRAAQPQGQPGQPQNFMSRIGDFLMQRMMR